MRAHAVAIIVLATLACTQASAQRSFLERLGFKKSTSLAETEIADGLREALTVGIDNVVEVLRQEDGYFGDEAIKIPLPDSFSRIESPLRKVGYGAKLDEFLLSMNRAAESAAPAARDIFVEAIVAMSIEDAEKILKGKDTAATDYFEKTTIDPLTETFTPIVKEKMAEFEVVNQYNELVARYNTIPFVRDFLSTDVEAHAVQGALNGLFYTLGEEEKRIREDPAARVTDLLEKVFGS